MKATDFISVAVLTLLSPIIVGLLILLSMFILQKEVLISMINILMIVIVFRLSPYCNSHRIVTLQSCERVQDPEFTHKLDSNVVFAFVV